MKSLVLDIDDPESIMIEVPYEDRKSCDVEVTREFPEAAQGSVGLHAGMLKYWPGVARREVENEKDGVSMCLRSNLNRFFLEIPRSPSARGSLFFLRFHWFVKVCH